MNQERARKTSTERLLGFSKSIDKIGIVGGVAVGLLHNPALGGA